ncbi:MAG TPA: M2 family metallopeptidase [Bryobacteraceae bacterium]|nr:M2 family metallopeptidase [Bryobacteraceae bacterium]
MRKGLACVRNHLKCVFGVIAMVLLAGCSRQPTVDDAKKFLDEAEQKSFDLGNESQQASWVQENFITDDTEAISAKSSQRAIDYSVQAAKEAKKYYGLQLPDDMRRKMTLLKTGLTLATPADPKESAEVTKLAAALDAAYGKGKYCREEAKSGVSGPGGSDKCLDIGDITRIMANSTNPAELLEVWKGWHTISPPMRKDFARFVELSNKGARELGFADTGAMWRSKYDMPADDFSKELDRLWEQVRPLYLSLHTYVRWKLREKYGDAVPANGPIPAHLLGNIWAQDWTNINKLVAPAGSDPGYDLTQILKARKTEPLQMVRYGEGFFKSLGFDPLPETFWQRSLFVKPRDREVVCHASAWDIDGVNDLRIKVCIDINEEDFTTIHHELGHNFYQRAYNQQPPLFRDSANDGFHEAIGDTIALSVTPEYLVKLGFINQAPDASKDIGLLLHRALEKVAFLPFGLMIDQWRWKVFSGEIPADKYNQGWWQLRQKYQGVAPAAERGEEFFDPGAKYHVPANVPYTRYFLSYILQFQFHRALARAAGCPAPGSQTPVHRCSIYESKEAGKKLNTMLAMGLSKPWQDALFELTGSRQMDATAILDYFAPLKAWLDEQNKGKPSGW